MTAFLKKLPSEHEKILKYAYENLIGFGKIFLADYKKSKNPPYHYTVGQELISDSNKPCAMILFRGSGKTTLIKTKVIRDFVFSKKAKEWGFSDFSDEMFVGWISSSQRRSVNNVNYVRLNLEFNRKLKFYFGNLRGSVWNSEDIVTKNGNRLISGSNLGSFRGDTLATVESGAVRYSYVVADDIESELNTITQNARDKLKDNLFNGVFPAIQKNRPGARLFYIGTPVHFDAIAQNFLDDYYKHTKENTLDEYPWKMFVQAARDKNGIPVWPEVMGEENLAKEKAMYAASSRGVGGFYQEYMLEVQGSENSLWTRKHIKTFDGEFKRHEGKNFLVINKEYVPINTFVGCDPATDIETRDSDYSVIMVVAVDPEENTYVLEYVRERGIPTLGLRTADGRIDGKPGVVDHLIHLYNKYHCSGGVVEDVAMNRSIFNALSSEKRRLGQYGLVISPEAPGGRNKINRIYTFLNPKFANGKIYMRESHHDLMDEIIKLGPKSKHDDMCDALYYSCLRAYSPSSGVTISNPNFKTKRRRRAAWQVV